MIEEAEFSWTTRKSRWDCLSLIATRIYLQNMKPEQALQESLPRYSNNGDLIGRFEYEGVITDALMLAHEAWYDAKVEKRKEVFEARRQARKKAM